MNEVVHTSPTIGSNVEEIVVKNTHFLMWDIGGQESLRSIIMEHLLLQHRGESRHWDFILGQRLRFCCAASETVVLSRQPFSWAWQLVCLFSAQTAAGAAPSQRSTFHKEVGPGSIARFSLSCFWRRKMNCLSIVWVSIVCLYLLQ